MSEKLDYHDLLIIEIWFTLKSLTKSPRNWLTIYNEKLQNVPCVLMQTRQGAVAVYQHLKGEKNEQI